MRLYQGLPSKAPNTDTYGYSPGAIVVLKEDNPSFPGPDHLQPVPTWLSRIRYVPACDLFDADPCCMIDL